MNMKPPLFKLACSCVSQTYTGLVLCLLCVATPKALVLSCGFSNAYPDPDYLADVTKDLAAIGIS